MNNFPIWLKLALRELRGGFTGFAVFVACIALGVGAIASVGSITRSLVAGIDQEGRTILGGDLAFRLAQRPASDAELQWFAAQGTVSQSISMRAMARLPDNSDQSLAEIKAVDGMYPLYGEVLLENAEMSPDMLAKRDGRWGVLVEATLPGRLGIGTGDVIEIAGMPVDIRGIIAKEPDRLSSGLTFGPRVLMTMDALEESGLVRPGSLVRWHYQVRLNDQSDAALTNLAEEAEERFPEAGWSIRSRANAAPRISSQIDRFRDYLTFVGLTALAVGGVGVANAVRAHLDGRRAVIATLKALGATGGVIARVYLAQILMLAGIGIGIGLVLGVIAPTLAGSFLASFFPVAEAVSGVYPQALLIAAIYGVLTALAFALMPLGRARQVPVSALYRDHVARHAGSAPLAYTIVSVVCVLAVAGLAILLAEQPLVAIIFIGSAIAGFVFLRLVAWAAMRLAKSAPQRAPLILRMALANIHRPNALTPTVVLSLGLGLTLLVTLALIETSLNRQLDQQIPANAPDFFFLDIPSARAQDFNDLVRAHAPDATVNQVPMLRGRIVSLNGVPSRDHKPVPPDAAWVLRGDRGLTYASEVPKGSTVVKGDWWGEGYDGPPLVSFEAELAELLGLEIGDNLVVNVLGRNLEVAIGNLRTVEWETLGINFVMVFSPNAVAGAPHMMLTTVAFEGDDNLDEQTALMRASADAFPEVTAVRVSEALDTFTDLIGKLALAIRLASGVTLVSAVLVLAGALASSHRFRIYDAVVLKTLGSTRWQLLSVYLIEFALLGVATAIFAVIAGSALSWMIVTQVMELSFAFAPGLAILAAAGAVVVTVALGLTGTWSALGQRPAPFLRAFAAG
ncbi:ABC transporter permease [Tepidamorphus sp. 3E244]|uniref:ABC transporter permease n=1 Tax=Tepidamorphus sp. 3E244 TaxID=3385498 RepID=UPI0038FCCE4E